MARIITGYTEFCELLIAMGDQDVLRLSTTANDEIVIARRWDGYHTRYLGMDRVSNSRSRVWIFLSVACRKLYGIPLEVQVITTLDLTDEERAQLTRKDLEIMTAINADKPYNPRRDTENRRFTIRVELLADLFVILEDDAAPVAKIRTMREHAPNTSGASLLQATINHFLLLTRGAIPAFSADSARVMAAFIIDHADHEVRQCSLADFLPDYIPATANQANYERFRDSARNVLAGLDDEIRADLDMGNDGCYSVFTIHGEYAGQDAADYLRSLENDGATLAPHWEDIRDADEDPDLRSYETALEMLETHTQHFADEINDLARNDPAAIPGVTYGSLWMDGTLSYVIGVDADYLSALDGAEEGE